MADSQLELIREYCDTTGRRLSGWEKDLLCSVLEDPERYDGFMTEEYEHVDEGRDYRDTWRTVTKRRYQINIGDGLSIHEWFSLDCDDGYSRENEYDYTDVRDIISILDKIRDDL